MLRYHYIARDIAGIRLEGDVQATSSDEAARQLMEKQLTPVNIMIAVAEKTQDKKKFDIKEHINFNFAPSLDELILFSHQMYTLLKAGVPIIRSITSLAESSHNPRFTKILLDVVDDLEGGRELATALSRHPHVFSNLFISMARVGESTGRLDEAFYHINQYLEFEKVTRERIQMTLRYPLFVIFAISLAIVIISVTVIPAFATIFSESNMPLPFQTQLIITVSNFFVQHWYWLSLEIVSLAIIFMVFIKTERGRYHWDRYKLRIPIVGGIIQRITLGRFARAFATALSAGVPLTQSLMVTTNVINNTYMAKYIRYIQHGIERGDSLSHAIKNVHLFPNLVIQMVEVGEESGTVDELLEEIADFYEHEVDYNIKHLSSLVEPILLAGMGIIVLILALGVFLPMWDLMELYRH